MSKKTRKEEEDLIFRIKAYRKEVISGLKDNFFQEKDERHSNGEIFFEGYWLPKDLVPKIQQKIAKRVRVVFFEIHLLVLVVLFFNILLWIVFNRFLLP